MIRKTIETITIHDQEPATRTMRDEVLRGLSQSPKMLPSQYLYDGRGARLFERICETEEYYLTRTEVAIMRRNMEDIAERIGPGALVIEPGSGSGTKTQLLLENLDEPAGYVPIDVAKQQLIEFATEMDERFPDLDVLPVCADFTGDYEVPDCNNEVRRRVAYFPGSTIGNFTRKNALSVLRHMSELCEQGGSVLIGVDLKKDRDRLEAAYDDAAGVSREFALNYLHRLNRELDADFVVSAFGYEAPYNEADGRIEMALVSQRDQTARIDGREVGFESDERIGTEFSYKYSPDEFAALADRAGLTVDDVWMDSEKLFSVQHLRPA